MSEGFWVGSVFLLYLIDLGTDLEEVGCVFVAEQFKVTVPFLGEVNLQELRIPKFEILCWAHVSSLSELFQWPGCQCLCASQAATGDP